MPGWADGIADTELKNWVANQDASKFGTLEDALRGHKELLSLRGVPADQLVKLASLEDKDAWHGAGGIFSKLGRPDDASGYELPKFEGGEGAINLVDPFREAIFELGVSKATGEQLGARMLGYIEKAEAALEAEREQKAQREVEMVQKEWGEQYDARMVVARQGASVLGFDVTTEEGLATMDGFMKTVGAHNFINRMYEIGQMVQGSFGQGDFGMGQENRIGSSPAEAKAEIARLEADQEFMAKANDPSADGHREAYERLSKLYQDAHRYDSENDGLSG